MKINFNEKDKLLNLEIDEEIDHHKAEILRRNADYEIQRRNPKRVILDFNNVYFMDSAGIGMVIGRYKTASMVGAKLEMKNVRKNIRKIFEMTGVLKIIPIIEEEEKSEKTKKTVHKNVKKEYNIERKTWLYDGKCMEKREN